MNRSLLMVICINLLCSSLVLAQVVKPELMMSDDGQQHIHQLSDEERVTCALMFPGAAHYKSHQKVRGAVYLGASSLALIAGVSFATLGYAKEQEYLNANQSPKALRESANNLYENANTSLWIAATVWGVSILDAWLGESVTSNQRSIMAPSPVSHTRQAALRADQVILDRREAKAKARAEAKAKARAEAKAKAQVEAKAKARAEAKAKAQVEAKAKAQVEAKAKAQVEAKAKAQVEAKEENKARSNNKAKAEKRRRKQK